MAVTSGTGCTIEVFAFWHTSGSGPPQVQARRWTSNNVRASERAVEEHAGPSEVDGPLHC